MYRSDALHYLEVPSILPTLNHTPPLTIPSMHGTFRPSLMSLLNRNTDALVEEKTRDAYQLLISSPTHTLYDTPNILPALTHLSTATLPLTPPKRSATKQVTQKLSGVGPATASLFLSVMDMQRVPFFSDELFRWVMWNKSSSSSSSSSAKSTDGKEGNGKGKAGKTEATESGWRRKIKYDMKEYAQLLERVAEIRERLGVSAVEVEKCAWVLGIEAMGAVKHNTRDAEAHDQDVLDEVELRDKVEKGIKKEEKEPKKEKGMSVSQKGQQDKAIGRAEAKKMQMPAKRKREEPISPPEGLRRSTRRRTSGS